MSVIQEKNKNKWTRDGRSWSFRVYYKDIRGIRRQHQSIMYKTKKEAIEAEREWLNKENVHVQKKNLTFKDLYNLFYDFQKTRVKETTFMTYIDRVPYLQPLDQVRLTDFSLKHYEYWRKWINEKPIKSSTKNDIQKFLKAILNFGTKVHKYNFDDVYQNMTSFTDPNEEPREMDFYTYEEFLQFIKNVPDLKYRCLFKTLFYCGLRNGEMRGLKWSRIDWNDKQLKVLTQIPTKYSSRHFKETTLKTNGSKRTIPIADDLYRDLEKYHKELKELYKEDFTDDWYVFGDYLPIVADNPHAYQINICNHIGLKIIRLHDFRHSCASFLINNGADILTVAKFLGHSKIEETLETYAHLYRGKLSDIVNLTNKISKDTENSLESPNKEPIISTPTDDTTETINNIEEPPKCEIRPDEKLQYDNQTILNALHTLITNAINVNQQENMITKNS